MCDAQLFELCFTPSIDLDTAIIACLILDMARVSFKLN